MRSKNTLRIVLVAIAVSGAFLVLNSAQHSKDQACKESMDTCCKKAKEGAKGGMIWENLSHQFFSTF